MENNEDITLNLTNELKRIAKHYGLDIENDEKLQKLLQDTGFDKTMPREALDIVSALIIHFYTLKDTWKTD